MYFRFPVLLLFIFLGLAGLMFFQGNFIKPVTQANGQPAENEQPTDKIVSTKSGIATIRPVDLKAHLEFLADDLLEGRDTGSRGARIAANYIATQFERLGLKAVVDNGSYFQPVILTRKQVLPSSELSVEINGEMVPLSFGDDFLVARPPVSDNKLLTFETVFVGFGIIADEYNYNDYAGLNVNGKAVIYLSGEPASADDQFFAGDARTEHSSSRVKRRVAEYAGAGIAISVIRDDQLNHFSWDGLSALLSRARFELSANPDNPEAKVFPNIIVHPEAAKLFFAEEKLDYQAIDENATAGRVEPFAMKKRIQVKIDFEKNDLIDNNVLGYLEGSDPELKSEVIVFTAHYDHVGIGRPVAGDSVYNGASDNASGVAGLLELAEAFATLPIAPRRSMLFLAVTAEEKGLLGSSYYVDNPIFPLSQTVANFNLDMIGIGDTTALVVYGIDRTSLGEDIRQAAEQIGLKILPDDMPEENVFYRSDHYNFARKGIPTIFPSFGIQRSGKADFNKFYHQPSDDKNLWWLNYRYMQRHVQTVFLAALSVANADQAPSWTPGDEFEKVRQNTEE